MMIIYNNYSKAAVITAEPLQVFTAFECRRDQATDIGCESVFVVVAVMTSPSGTAYMGGQRCPEEMRNLTRL